jgi:hypothetical protein
MTPATVPARMRAPWYRLWPAVSVDEPRLAVLLVVLAAGSLASWPVALLIHGVALAAVTVTILLSRLPS